MRECSLFQTSSGPEKFSMHLSRKKTLNLLGVPRVGRLSTPVLGLGCRYTHSQTHSFRTEILIVCTFGTLSDMEIHLNRLPKNRRAVKPRTARPHSSRRLTDPGLGGATQSHHGAPPHALVLRVGPRTPASDLGHPADLVHVGLYTLPSGEVRLLYTVGGHSGDWSVWGCTVLTSKGCRRERRSVFRPRQRATRNLLYLLLWVGSRSHVPGAHTVYCRVEFNEKDTCTYVISDPTRLRE